jgi:O-methyltransferase involved in polyketide biosynthesis
MEFVMNKARESGTPFHSLFSPTQILELANGAGFKKSEYVSSHDLYQRYFSKRTDNLKAGNAEAFLVART